ncbi:hypothetical protein NMY22_g4412 [Coprinellus aureogranulatus]|nr:hypothetical protein NMY22_g4412 [Coprinellus aureogranulatus]
MSSNNAEVLIDHAVLMATLQSGGTISESDEDSEQEGFISKFEEAVTPRPEARHEVLCNEDILSELVLHLLGSNDWKSAVATLTISRAFFHAVASIVWRSMHSLKPVFKLLPWFLKPNYNGIGVFKYAGVEDWTRFNLYAPLIRNFDFLTESMSEMTAYQALELLTLDGRPTFLFPNLRSVSISPLGRFSVASPFLLLSPSLNMIQYQFSNPQDKAWDPRSPLPELVPPPDDLMTVLPRLAATCIQLRSFSYWGPTTHEFLSTLCQIKSLRVLQLKITNKQNPNGLQYIHNLPCIEELSIEGLSFEGGAEEPRVLDLVPSTSRMPRLQALTIRAASLWHGRVALCLAPTTLRRLHLQMVKRSESTSLFLIGYTYFKLNTALEDVYIEFLYQDVEEPAPPSQSAARGEREAAEGFETALARLGNLRRFFISGIPFDLAAALLPRITEALVLWPVVTCISFRVQPPEPLIARSNGTTPRLPAPSTSPFPGLSFLPLVIGKLCPSLEEFEFHFDTILVAKESLEMFLDAREGPTHFRLRKLTINTGDTRAGSGALRLPQSRKADIAMFLDRLFPGLEVVRGSAGKVWDDINALVAAFRRYKTRIFADVEGLLDLPKLHAVHGGICLEAGTCLFKLIHIQDLSESAPVVHLSPFLPDTPEHRIDRPQETPMTEQDVSLLVDFLLDDRVILPGDEDATASGDCVQLRACKLSDDIQATRAAHEVVFSEDIFPEVLQCLVHIYGPSRWKLAVARLLTVNTAFFQAGISILWKTMDGLRPAFKLLPWFSQRQYAGVGTYKYLGAEDWKRFSIYAPYIRRFLVEPTPRLLEEMSPHHAIELLTLTERPSPLFPNLQDIAISPLGASKSPSLFLLASPSLRTFKYLCSTPRIALNTQEVVLDTTWPPTDLTTVLPRLAATAVSLQEFTYCGTTNDEFLSRIGQLTSLTSLRLSITSAQTPDALQNIRRLPNLEVLEIQYLCVMAGGEESRVHRVRELFPPDSRLHNLKSLYVFATPFGQGAVGTALCPTKLQRLRLLFLKATELPWIQQCGWVYFLPNPDIYDLSIEFACQNFTSPRVLTSGEEAAQILLKAKKSFPLSLTKLKALRQVSFKDVPYSLAAAIYPDISTAIPSWTLLQGLSFRIDLKTPSPTDVGPTPPSSPPFVGLSFLASVVRNDCPNLEELEFHFNKVLVREESLEEYSSTSQGIHHPLRKLKVNTGGTLLESSRLGMSLSRKADIAMFLERLFPVLATVEGSASTVWDDIGELIVAFRKQRERVAADLAHAGLGS